MAYSYCSLIRKTTGFVIQTRDILTHQEGPILALVNLHFSDSHATRIFYE